MLIKTLGYFIKNVSEKAYQVLTQDDTERPEHLGGVPAPRINDMGETIDVSVLDNLNESHDFIIIKAEDIDETDINS